MRVGTFIAVSGPTERVEIHRQDSDLAVHTTHFNLLTQDFCFFSHRSAGRLTGDIYGINCKYLEQDGLGTLE